MKLVMATLTVAVLAGVQPLSGQIGQEIEPRDEGVVVPAREQAPVAAQERTHVVRRGDTLWDLAGTYYDNPYTWPTIHDANRNVVEDPHWIYPDEVLVIPGMPTAIAEGPPGAAGEITPVAQAVPQPVPSRSRRTRFYRQNVDASIISAEDLRQMGVQPGEFYAAPWLANPDALPLVGAVLRTVDAPEGGDEDDVMVHPFDDVLVEYRGSTRPQPGARLLVVNVLREFDDGADLFVIKPSGVLTVRATDPEIMTARVTEHWAPFSRGAGVIPLEAFPNRQGLAQPISDGPLGRVVGFMAEQELYGNADYGFLDLNASQVGIGDVVMVYRVPEADGTLLPAEPVAFVKIVRVGPDGSTFRVTKVMQRRLERGLPAQVVSRIP